MSSPAPRPLLVVDGDSLDPPRLPRTAEDISPRRGKPGNALLGFSNFITRLWQSEQPRAVIVGWDSLDHADVPPRALRGLPGRTRVRRRPPRAARPAPGAGGAPSGSRPQRHRASRRMTSSRRQCARREKRGGKRSIVVTSDRDSFQLASEQTTTLQPTRGVSELARIGPAEVRERYGVDPNSARLHRAARRPLRPMPGAKGVGPKTAASLLAQYGTLEAMLDGRPLRRSGRGTADLPANGNAGRLRAPTSPR